MTHARPSTHRRWSLALWVGGLALVAVGAIVACTATGLTEAAPSASSPTATPTMAATSPMRWPVRTPSPEPTIRVPPSAPTRLLIPDLGIDAAVEEYSNAQVTAAHGWVDPPHRDVVAWWSGGGTPGDPPDNTVYLYGHVSQKPAVFDALSNAKVGEVVTVRTAAGQIDYRITAIPAPVAKSALSTTDAITQAVPGRLVLIGCYREPDQGSKPTTQNFVVIALQVQN